MFIKIIIIFFLLIGVVGCGTVEQEDEGKETLTQNTERSDSSGVNSSTSKTGQQLYASCAGCHGRQGEKEALGKSQPIGGQSYTATKYQLEEYKAGRLNQYGMGELMKGQVQLTSNEILLLSKYIETLFIKRVTEDKGGELLNAVYKNDFVEVKRLVESGTDINEKGILGYTPLLFACASENLRMVQYLIKHGADMNAQTNSGFGVIHKASMNKNPIILKYLLENYSLDTNDRGEKYCSPLDFSLRNNALQNYGTLENAKLLFKYGAKKSIDWKCNGYTPLMVSVLDEKAVRFLIDNGANIEIVNEEGKTAYDRAKDEKASDKILAMLVEGKTFENKNIFEKDGLFWELKTYENKYDRYDEIEAKKYCQDLKLGSHLNWRIPTVLEYTTILREEPYKGFVIDGIDSYHFNPKEFPNMTPARYWTILSDSSFGYQDVSWNFSKKANQSEKYFIRCVSKY